MAHFALICPPFFSHVKVFDALAEALARRGHRSTFVLNAGGERLVPKGATMVRTVPGDGAGRGDALDAVVRRAACATGPVGILGTVADTARLTASLCRGGADVLRDIGADAVVGDQMEPAAGLLAAHLGLPLISLACALPINAAPGVPSPFIGWSYDPSRSGLKRNRGGDRIAALFLGRQRRTIEFWSRRLGIPLRSTLEDCLSPILQIAQTVESFDFPRPRNPAFHAVGPIRSSGHDGGFLPFDIDPARPLIFASFGTLQGHRLPLFSRIAEASRRIGVQLLVAHCGRLSEMEAASIGATFVADFVPQGAALARADVCVTHGGLNTVLDALQASVPLLVIPIAFDQPGIAARIVHHGVGKRLSRVLLSSGEVEASLEALLAASTYRERAAAIGRDIAHSGGADLAARLIDQAICGQREKVA